MADQACNIPKTLGSPKVKCHTTARCSGGDKILTSTHNVNYPFLKKLLVLDTVQIPNFVALLRSHWKYRYRVRFLLLTTTFSMHLILRKETPCYKLFCKTEFFISCCTKQYRNLIVVLNDETEMCSYFIKTAEFVSSFY